jgi:DNA polymerase III epsilon subunit-like protein
MARLAHHLGQMPGEPENFKLGSVCKVYGIPEPTHDALEDVLATRVLYEKIVRRWR